MIIALEEFRKNRNIGVYGKCHDDVERLLMVISGGTELPHPRLMYGGVYTVVRTEILNVRDVDNIPWLNNSALAIAQYETQYNNIVVRHTKLEELLCGMLHMSVKDIYLWLERNAEDVLDSSKPRKWANVHGTVAWSNTIDMEDGLHASGDGKEPYLEFLVPTKDRNSDGVPMYLWYIINESALDKYMPFLTMGIEIVEYYHARVEHMSKQQLASALLVLTKNNPSALAKILDTEEPEEPEDN